MQSLWCPQCSTVLYEFLLNSYGTYIHDCDKNRLHFINCLFLAIISSCPPSVIVCLRSLANVIIIQMSAYAGNSKFVSLLLEHSADPNIQVTLTKSLSFALYLYYIHAYVHFTVCRIQRVPLHCIWLLWKGTWNV